MIEQLRNAGDRYYSLEANESAARGDALLNEGGEMVGQLVSLPELTKEIHDLPLDLIDVRPDQPRRGDAVAADDGAKVGKSIKRRGQKTEIKVVPYLHAESQMIRFMVVDGEQRFLAAQESGAATIRTVVEDELNLDDLFVDSAIANETRTPLSPIAAGKTLKRTLEIIRRQNPDLREEDLLVELKETFGRTHWYVTSRLRLVELDESLQGLVRSGDLNLTFAAKELYQAQLTQAQQQKFAGRLVQAARKGAVTSQALGVMLRSVSSAEKKDSVANDGERVRDIFRKLRKLLRDGVPLLQIFERSDADFGLPSSIVKETIGERFTTSSDRWRDELPKRMSAVASAIFHVLRTQFPEEFAVLAKELAPHMPRQEGAATGGSFAEGRSLPASAARHVVVPVESGVPIEQIVSRLEKFIDKKLPDDSDDTFLNLSKVNLLIQAFISAKSNTKDIPVSVFDSCLRMLTSLRDRLNAPTSTTERRSDGKTPKVRVVPQSQNSITKGELKRRLSERLNPAQPAASPSAPQA